MFFDIGCYPILQPTLVTYRSFSAMLKPFSTKGLGMDNLSVRRYPWYGTDDSATVACARLAFDYFISDCLLISNPP